MKRIISVSVIVFLLHCYTSLIGQINIDFGTSVKYLKGNEVSTVPSNWYVNSYSDDGWRIGFTPLWYGDGTGGTPLSDMQNTYSSIYLRSHFMANNVGRISKIQLSIDYDDGFVLWINGNEKLRINAPSVLTPEGFAPENHESGIPENYEIQISEGELFEGENLIAVHGFNVSLESSDFHIDLAASAILDAPSIADSLKTIISHESGFFDSPFMVTLEAEIDTLDVYYTLDGSHPGYSPTAVNLGSSGTVLIDPDDFSGRAETPAVVLRTSLMSTGFLPSFPQSRTYIFYDKLLTQGFPGGDWPNYNVNGQIIDYNIDTGISLGASYGDRMDQAFKAIPTMSVVTDLASLFDETQGIYVNAWGHGDEWERECSVELFDAGSVSFYCNAGLRIRGGWSRHNEFPKHSFRLFFRSMYGASKLYYPLFQDEGTDAYDKIDLRTSQNYAWSMGDSRNTMLREVFSRDLQRAMGKPYTRSRYYHLYLNGMYWGVYQTQERSEARFAASYFGGDDEDYDVVKVNTENWNYSVEATDGNLDLWRDVYSKSQQGFSDLEAYYEIQGLDVDGMPSKDGVSLVDVDNLIDYMIGIFYTGNFDAPTSSFGGNNGCNNFFAIKDRTNPIQGFQFFNHDAEHSLFSYGASPGVGIGEDRVNLASRTDNLRMEVNSFSVFHPQWLHHKLCDNDEYVLRFSDRVYQCLKPGGILSKEQSMARFDERVQELDPAIIAESARWGDSKSGESFTRDEHWLSEVNKVRNDFFRLRPDIFIGQLQSANLYPSVEGVDFYIDQAYTAEELHTFSESILLKINKPSSAGELVYTVDGTDPRKIGGDILETAIISGSSLNMSVSHSTEVKARILDGNEWSALRKIKLLKDDEDYSGIKITEIHYNPLDSVFGTDTIFGKSFEFLEFKNISDHAISLRGLSLDSAISYTFLEDDILHSKAFYVVASKPVDFFRRYGMYASGNYRGNLSNGGERIVLLDKNDDELMSFRYEIFHPWAALANGIGYSLVPEYASPDGDPGEASYWLSSAHIGGSPFANDLSSEITSIEFEEEIKFRIYPNPTRDYVVIHQAGSVDSRVVDMKIMDINGRLVFASGYSIGERIELRELGLTSGIYFVSLKDGQHISNHKIIFVAE